MRRFILLCLLFPLWLQAKELIIGGTLEPPLKFLDAQGVPHGLDVDVVSTIFGKLRIPIRIELTDSGRALRERAAKVPEALACRIPLERDEIGATRNVLRKLLDALARFGSEAPRTRVEVIESVLGGTGEALLGGQADIAVTPSIPPGFLGRPLMNVRLLAVASPDHPLHRLGRALHENDLRAHRHLPVRATSASRDRRTTTVEVEQRWTFSSMGMSIAAACAGHGFAWYPEAHIRDELISGRLKTLPLGGAEARIVPLYVVIADPDAAGPGVRRLEEILAEGAAG